MSALIRPGIRYGLFAFAIGYVFGLLRVLVLTPALGAWLGYYIEFPLVTVAVFALGCWMGNAFGQGRSLPWLLGLGVIGVVTLIAIEASLALVVLGQPFQAYLQSYNLAAGHLFPIGLAFMAVAPMFSRFMPRSG
ncbi:MAG: hypothetical protein KDJ62_16110 [Rhodobiaceae bacterium]|nr:hypothetical protein [Rhodobiaceae bacterium]MCC0048493.1 hypothetical protein [Rhodobiaceae bacterium]